MFCLFTICIQTLGIGTDEALVSAFSHLPLAPWDVSPGSYSLLHSLLSPLVPRQHLSNVFSYFYPRHFHLPRFTFTSLRPTFYFAWATSVHPRNLASTSVLEWVETVPKWRERSRASSHSSTALSAFSSVFAFTTRCRVSRRELLRWCWPSPSRPKPSEPTRVR